MADQASSPEGLLDFYVDAVKMGITPFGVAIELGTQGLTIEVGERGPVKVIATVRMSPQHALVFAKVLLKNMRIYEEKVGKIELPTQLYEEMGIEPD